MKRLVWAWMSGAITMAACAELVFTSNPRWWPALGIAIAAGLWWSAYSDIDANQTER